MAMAATIGFNHGSHFLLNDRQVHVTRVINGNLFTVEDVVSLVVYQYTNEQLLGMWNEGRIRPMPIQVSAGQPSKSTSAVALCNYPQAQIDKALRKKRYIDSLLFQEETVVFSKQVLGPRLRAIAKLLGDSRPPSVTTAYRWFKRYQTTGDPTRALLDRFEFRGWFGCRASAEVQELLLELIEEVFLGHPKIPMKEIHHRLVARVAQLNALRTADQQLTVPSYYAVRRAIKSYPAYEQAIAKYGKQEASIRFRTSMSTVQAKFVLEAAEIDHTPIDLFAVDATTFLPLGRPLLTIMIDRKSRMLLGIFVSFGTPSTEAVMQCMRHAIVPKDYIRERYPRVEGEWPCYGLPETLVCDNGLEFHSKALEQACFELGIILQFCPKKKPYFKGRVERAFRSIAQNFFHAQPGTSLANWMDRHGYDPLKTAVATFDELMHALHIWIVDVYSAQYHRTLKRPPIAVWKDGVLDNPPRLPDLHVLETALTEFEARTLWHYGIELFNLRYNSRELGMVRMQLGEKVSVQVRYNRSDIGHIYVIHPSTGEAIKVPALAYEYANGLRLELHQLVCKEVREAGMAETNPLKLAEAKERMCNVIGEALASRKLKNRKRGARWTGVNSNDHQRPRRPTPTNEPTEACRTVSRPVTPRQFKVSAKGDPS
jgi:putative transposase